LFCWYECVEYCRKLSLAALVVKMVFCTAEQTMFIVKSVLNVNCFKSAKKLLTFIIL
jgi:hypothetical protein